MDAWKQYFGKMSKNNLVEECRNREIDSSGTKDDLINRLTAAELGKNFMGNSSEQLNNESDDDAKDSDSSGTTVIESTSERGTQLRTTIQERRDYEPKKTVDQNNANKNDADYQMAIMKQELELIRKERDLLLRERDIMRRMDQLAAIEKPGVRIDKSGVVEHMLFDFNGEENNFSAWVNQLKGIQDEYQIEEAGLRLLMVKKLKGKAQKWFYSKSAHLSMATDELIQEMRKLYDQRLNRVQLKRNFETRLWRNDEEFIEYFHEKIILSNQLDLVEEELVQNIIEGIPSESLRSQATMHQFKTSDQLLQSLRGLQFEKPLVKPTQQSHYSNSKSNYTYYSKSGPQQTGAVKKFNHTEAIKKEPAKVRCYNCNLLGHGVSQCNRPKREKGSCFTCGEMGHYSLNCPKLKSSEMGGRTNNQRDERPK